MISKYIGANLIRNAKNLYGENYKAFLYVPKGDLKKYRNVACFGIPVIMKAIYKFNTITV